MAARADRVSRVDHDGVTLVEGATSDVRFAFTERTGGVSEDAYSSLNLGSHVGDDPFAVQENRRRALEAMGATECEHNLLVPNQVHGDHIVTVTSNGADDLEAVREQIAEGCDAIVCTDQLREEAVRSVWAYASRKPMPSAEKIFFSIPFPFYSSRRPSVSPRRSSSGCVRPFIWVR